MERIRPISNSRMWASTSMRRARPFHRPYPHFLFRREVVPVVYEVLWIHSDLTHAPSSFYNILAGITISFQNCDRFSRRGLKYPGNRHQKSERTIAECFVNQGDLRCFYILQVPIKLALTVAVGIAFATTLFIHDCCFAAHGAKIADLQNRLCCFHFCLNAVADV